MISMQLQYTCLLFIFLNMPDIFAWQVLFIMGPSCSGKTTIARAVQQELGQEWILAEYDVIEDEMHERADHVAVFNNLMRYVNKKLKENKNVLIDTNFMCLPACEQLISLEKIYIVCSAPLTILLERNRTRNSKKNRTSAQVDIAQEWIKESYNNFFSSEQPIRYDCIIDTTSTTIEDCTTKIISLIHQSNLL
jgi:adenylylsulfate kinase-like enzyme